MWGLRHARNRLGTVEPWLLLHYFLFQSAHRIEILREFFLVLSPHLLFNGLRLLKHRIQNASMPGKPPADRLFLSGILVREHRLVGGANVHRWHLHAGARDAEEVRFIHLQRQRGESSRRAQMLYYLLIHAHVSLREMHGLVDLHPAEQGRHSRVPGVNSMVEIGIHIEVFAVPLQRFERIRQVIISPGFRREKRLRINAVVIREDDNPLHRLPGSRGSHASRQKRFHHWQGDDNACIAQKAAAVD